MIERHVHLLSCPVLFSSSLVFMSHPVDQSTASNVCDDEAVARALQQALSFSPDAYDHSVAFALQEEENARGTELQEVRREGVDEER
eukprot:278199-Hanusia_phi.AAC.1